MASVARSLTSRAVAKRLIPFSPARAVSISAFSGLSLSQPSYKFPVFKPQFRSIHYLSELDCERRNLAGLPPFLNQESFDIHRQVERNLYRKLNKLTDQNEYEEMDLITIILQTSRSQEEAVVYNTAAEMWNHTFFWQTLRAGNTQNAPVDEVLKRNFEIHFDGYERFKKKFAAHCKVVNGSGWVWLVDRLGHFEIVISKDSETPVTMGNGICPLLGIDMWEHAYVVQYGFDIDAYVENFFNVVNWDVVSKRLHEAEDWRLSLKGKVIEDDDSPPPPLEHEIENSADFNPDSPNWERNLETIRSSRGNRTPINF